ncbi:hypothetical protein BTS2_1216 [Bacillus sp. TS-2]|nr:hypothetical protein BTS2_1216 [Bacillus sp. TS-2]
MIKMSKILFAISTLLFFICSSFQVNADVSGTRLMTISSVRITVVDSGIEYEWEYDNPSHYEYEEGNYVQKGENAKQEVEEMVKLIEIDEHQTIENMISLLKKRYHQLEKVDIRYMDGKSHLYIWTWKA